MLYIAQVCPICGVGPIGFRMCSDTRTLVLLCYDCGTVWRDPATVDAAHALFAPPPSYTAAALRCSVAPPSRWATRNEIARAGWLDAIGGEWQPEQRR